MQIDIFKIWPKGGYVPLMMMICQYQKSCLQLLANMSVYFLGKVFIANIDGLN